MNIIAKLPKISTNCYYRVLANSIVSDRTTFVATIYKTRPICCTTYLSKVMSTYNVTTLSTNSSNLMRVPLQQQKLTYDQQIRNFGSTITDFFFNIFNKSKCQEKDPTPNQKMQIVSNAGNSTNSLLCVTQVQLYEEERVSRKKSDDLCFVQETRPISRVTKPQNDDFTKYAQVCSKLKPNKKKRRIVVKPLGKMRKKSTKYVPFENVDGECDQSRHILTKQMCTADSLIKNVCDELNLCKVAPKDPSDKQYPTIEDLIEKADERQKCVASPPVIPSDPTFKKRPKTDKPPSCQSQSFTFSPVADLEAAGLSIEEKCSVRDQVSAVPRAAEPVSPPKPSFKLPFQYESNDDCKPKKTGSCKTRTNCNGKRKYGTDVAFRGKTDSEGMACDDDLRDSRLLCSKLFGSQSGYLVYSPRSSQIELFKGSRNLGVLRATSRSTAGQKVTTKCDANIKHQNKNNLKCSTNDAVSNRTKSTVVSERTSRGAKETKRPNSEATSRDKSLLTKVGFSSKSTRDVLNSSRVKKCLGLDKSLSSRPQTKSTHKLSTRTRLFPTLEQMGNFKLQTSKPCNRFERRRDLDSKCTLCCDVVYICSRTENAQPKATKRVKRQNWKSVASGNSIEKADACS